MTQTSTSSPLRPAGSYPHAPFQDGFEPMSHQAAIQRPAKTLEAINVQVASTDAPDIETNVRPLFALPIIRQSEPGADAAVIQVWEGTVLDVDEPAHRLRARLHAKLGVIPDHVGEIDFEWINEQDLDLVRIGAVFYLTLYKRIKRGGTVVNSQELRFRRQPNWTRRQIAAVDALADQLLAKFKPRAIAP